MLHGEQWIKLKQTPKKHVLVSNQLFSCTNTIVSVILPPQEWPFWPETLLCPQQHPQHPHLWIKKGAFSTVWKLRKVFLLLSCVREVKGPNLAFRRIVLEEVDWYSMENVSYSHAGMLAFTVDNLHSQLYSKTKKIYLIYLNIVITIVWISPLLLQALICNKVLLFQRRKRERMKLCSDLKKR